MGCAASAPLVADAGPAGVGSGLPAGALGGAALAAEMRTHEAVGGSGHALDTIAEGEEQRLRAEVAAAGEEESVVGGESGGIGKRPSIRRSSTDSSSTRSGGSGGKGGGSGNALGASEPEEFFGLDINYQDMELRESIGSGTYGQVFKCRFKGKLFALKRVFVPEGAAERAEMLEDFAKEVGILSVLRHERIVSFKGAVRAHPNYALLFELCEGCVGTLLRMVRRRKVQVTWSICVAIAKDAAEAVAYLHSLRPCVIHRDLKAENLLLTSRFRCKLTDFGLSRVYEGRKRTMTVCGTPCWVAPEIFRGEPYNEKIDVYSFGVVLWELFAGKKPYTEYESVELPYRVGKKGLRPPLLRHCPPSVNRLMKDCWQENCALRPTFAEIQRRLLEVESDLEQAEVISLPAHQTKIAWGQQHVVPPEGLASPPPEPNAASTA